MENQRDRYFLGFPKGKTLVLEQVTTTGNSLIKTIDNLLDYNIDVVGAITLIDIMELIDDRSHVGLILKERVLIFVQ